MTWLLDSKALAKEEEKEDAYESQRYSWAKMHFLRTATRAKTCTKETLKYNSSPTAASSKASKGGKIKANSYFCVDANDRGANLDELLLRRLFHLEFVRMHGTHSLPSISSGGTGGICCCCCWIFWKPLLAAWSKGRDNTAGTSAIAGRGSSNTWARCRWRTISL